jgi:hypothetical protein
MQRYFTASSASLTGLSAVRNILRLPGAAVGKKPGEVEADKLPFVLPVPSAVQNGRQRLLNYSVKNGLLSAQTTMTQHLLLPHMPTTVRGKLLTLVESL